MAWLSRLPPRVAGFYLRCLWRAWRAGDRWTLDASSRPRELAALLRLARGHRIVVEDGTASAWTAAALVLAEPTAEVITLDPHPGTERERYLALLDSGTRTRIRLVQTRTEDGPGVLKDPELGRVELLFIDGDHSRDGVIAAFEAWKPALASGAVVAFHDYGDPDWPGVTEAVADLGLSGEVHGSLFVARV